MAELINNSGYQEFTLDMLKTPEGINSLNFIIRQLAQNMPSDGENVRIFQGYGTPEASITANISSLYMRLDGAAGTAVYIKQTGTGNTGWVAVPGTSTGGFGDVIGPSSAVNNDVTVFDGTTGKLIKDSGILYTNLVTAAAVLTDNFILRGDGGVRGAQTSVLSIDDTTGNVTGPAAGFKIIGGTGTTADLSLQTTSGVGTTGADMHFLVGNNGATEAVTILNNSNVGIGTTSPSIDLDIENSDSATGIDINNTSVAAASSCLFPGGAETDNVTIPTGNSVNTTGSWTIEGKLYFTSHANTYCMVMSAISGGTYVQIAHKGVDNVFRIFTNSWSEGGGQAVSASFFPSNGVWYDWAITYDGTDIKIYLGGTFQTTATRVNIPDLRSFDIQFGADATNGRQLNGNQDEIRISNIVRYSGSYTPSTGPFTSDANTLLLLHFDGVDEATTTIDSSSLANTVTMNGDTELDTATSPFTPQTGIPRIKYQIAGTTKYAIGIDGTDSKFKIGLTDVSDTPSVVVDTSSNVQLPVSLTVATLTGMLKGTAGLVSVATQGTDYYKPGGTDVAVADGGTGASTAAGARTNLKIGVTLFDHYADVGNVGTGEDDLYSDTTAAGTLASNGDKIDVQYGGVFVSSATATRQIRMYFAGSSIFDSGALTLSLSAAWTIYTTIIRVSATVIRYMVSLATEGAALSAYTAVGELTSLTLSGTNVVKITGEAAGVGAATNDIVAKLGTIRYEPAA